MFNLKMPMGQILIELDVLFAHDNVRSLHADMKKFVVNSGAREKAANAINDRFGVKM